MKNLGRSLGRSPASMVFKSDGGVARRTLKGASCFCTGANDQAVRAPVIGGVFARVRTRSSQGPHILSWLCTSFTNGRELQLEGHPGHHSSFNQFTERVLLVIIAERIED